jgi:hypothetical protein
VKRYGVATQMVNLIAETYWGYDCRVVQDDRVSELIYVQTVVRQGCIQSNHVLESD